jgi:hypothetical protein
MGMSPRLLRPRASGFDPATQVYLNAVAVADGQQLEPAVKKAINDFVVGCKRDGTWSAIKASCILMGARTLSGALTPLVGSAPTNNGPFVSGDYNRKTGLVGNGSTKYINTNRNNNADPQDSFHLSAYRSEALEPTTSSLIGAGAAGDAGRSNISVVQNPEFGSGYFFRSRNNSPNTAGNALNQAERNTAGFIAHSRNSSENVNYVAVTETGSFTRTSDTPANQSICVFAQLSVAGVAGGFAASRMAFYSIGESLNVSSLTTRVNALYTAIGAAIP